ncbi:MAG TPA: metallophosphoesterase family protein [Ktedonobacteraceae bacterium]|nr:metallophosphoesterase family protein [Ktedonobacteraceae bacterium]
MQLPVSTYVIGDVHGQLKKLTRLLQDAQLISDHLTWEAGTTALWFIGDLLDRGPDSIGVLDFVMRLQGEAAAAGGQVGCLLGNHELLMLGAYRFGRRSTGLGSNFIAKWKQNGGNRKDLARLTMQHLDWLAQLPAMAMVEDRLLLHADAPFYIRYGNSIEEVNANIRGLMSRSDALAWEELLEDFARRGVFASRENGEDFARRFLSIFGGQQIVHGHTPISMLTRHALKHIIEPLVYAGGQCINVDGGMFLGGQGFVYQFSPQSLDGSAPG